MVEKKANPPLLHVQGDHSKDWDDPGMDNCDNRKYNDQTSFNENVCPAILLRFDFNNSGATYGYWSRKEDS